MNLENELSTLLGIKGWIAARDSIRLSRDWLNQYGEPPVGIALPTTTEEVAEVVKACARAKVAIVPQGGNTSLVGGAVIGPSGGVILSLSRMNEISQVDSAAATIEVEAGVVLEDLHRSLLETDFMFPLHIAADGSAQIGGMISTNAGGSHAFKFGMMQDLVIGVEVVLPNGQIWNGMRRVLKDNAGYQLRKLFCGAEGTLGIITRAVLKLTAAHRKQVTGLLALSDISSAIAIASKLRAEASEFLTAIEFFSEVGLQMTLSSVEGMKYPLSTRSPFYLLIEAGTCSILAPLEEIILELLEREMRAGQVIDATLATSHTQRAALWSLRDNQPEGQRRHGKQIKNDVSVPVGLLPEFLRKAEFGCASILPNIRTNAFGHLADGNVHFNLTPPVGQPDFSGLEQELSLFVSNLATDLGGSFAAEHGLGRNKVKLAEQLRDNVERTLMAKIKSAVDELGIMNPGVIVSQRDH